jgi:hypothetical protein
MGGQFPTINYYYMHPEEAKEKLRVLCANCNWRQNDSGRSTCAQNPSMQASSKMRRELIDLVGGPKCVGCGEQDFRVLTLDHIHGGGTSDRVKHGGLWPMLRYYYTHPSEATEKLDVLCRNCNWKKHRTRAGKVI